MYPEDLRYTAEHEWVKPSSDTGGDAGSSTVRVGITDFAQDALGDIVYVSLPEVGTEIAAGDSVGELESTKSVSDVYAPLSGQVTAVNGALDDAPELVNSDPYGEGWLFELSLGDAGAVDTLLDAAAYQAGLSG
ncbi:MAG: glycine cleavage system protein GcvH [Nocardioidaceae bacterium]